MLTVAPLGPSVVLIPDLLTFKYIPGMIFILFLNLNDMLCYIVFEIQFLSRLSIVATSGFGRPFGDLPACRSRIPYRSIS